MHKHNCFFFHCSHCSYSAHSNLPSVLLYFKTFLLVHTIALGGLYVYLKQVTDLDLLELSEES
jgi:hypothetical protein